MGQIKAISYNDKPVYHSPVYFIYSIMLSRVFND